MNSVGYFPFGQPVLSVVQQDRRPKKVFVLGVYASAVHARWKRDGKTLVPALAVASEPYIFWIGDGADEIIRRIAIPPELGTLAPATKSLNGPSGNVLDKQFLKPLGFARDDAWLCDLVPHSCMNPRQEAALKRESDKLGVPIPSSVPRLPDTLAAPKRRQEILSELQESRASLLVLLGDLPIQWFLKPLGGHWNRLSDFQPYGKRYPVKLDGWEGDVLPLCHPRQAWRLGMSSANWERMHREGMASSAASQPSR